MSAVRVTYQTCCLTLKLLPKTLNVRSQVRRSVLLASFRLMNVHTQGTPQELLGAATSMWDTIVRSTHLDCIRPRLKSEVGKVRHALEESPATPYWWRTRLFHQLASIKLAASLCKAHFETPLG